MSCTIFGRDGIDVVEKTVERRAVEDIALVMDADGGVAEVLGRYGLLGGRSISEVAGLIRGEWMTDGYHGTDGARDIYFNALCSVDATGNLVMLPMAFWNVVVVSRIIFFTLYYKLGLLSEWCKDLYDYLVETLYPPLKHIVLYR